MLYIKNGRIYTLSFSFELPEEMSIVTDPAGVSPDTLVMESLDGKYQIEIGAWTKEIEPREQVELYIGDHIRMIDVFEVVRGEMKGYAAIHRNSSWSEEHYCERLAFPMNEDGQNAFVLEISHETFEEGDRNQICNFMEQPNIERFIDSIRYEPLVCKSILQSKN